MNTVDPDTSTAHHSRRTSSGAVRAAATITTTAAVMISAAGLANAVELRDQPGITGPNPQAGVTPTPDREQPGMTPPPRPPQQSPLGVILPEPPNRAPSEYQDPPSYNGGGVQVGPYYNPTPSAPAPSWGEELLTLHAPAPVPEPPKYWVPVGPDRLGSKRASIETPSFVPIDVAWKINAYLSEAQQGTNTALQSVGISPSRADALAGGTVIGAATGACIGATVIGVPAAVFGAVTGGLIGGTIGGITGAAMGTLIPVPVIGTVTSGVAGTALGAAAGAAAGAAIVGIPAALIGGAAGGAIGGLVGFVLLADDGSDYTGPGVDDEVPMEEREVPEPGPTLTEQFTAQAESAITAGEDATAWVQAQPGGEQIIDQAATVIEQADTWVQAQPWSEQASAVVNQAAQDTVAAVTAAPETAAIAEAAIEVVTNQEPFEAGQFGELTDAANNALAALQGVVR